MICEHVQGRWPRNESEWQWYAKHCVQAHPNGFHSSANMHENQLAGGPADVQICTEEPLSPEEEETLF